MEIKKMAEDGPVLITPTIFKDERGYFYESFNEKEFKEKVANVKFVQDNQSKSAYGVLRGMHFQTGKYEQAKLVRVISGAVLDIVIDIRKDAPTYGHYYFAYLSEENHKQFFIPRGFAHGFLSLRDDTIFQYKCDNYYNKKSEGSYSWRILENVWKGFINEEDIIISEKDANAPMLV